MRVADLVLDAKAAGALLAWPYFSLTSYKLVSGLVQQGIQARTVIDVGANVGQFTIAAAKLFPGARIYSFEPLPACIVKLRQHVSTLGTVTCHHLALGDVEGEALLNINAYSQSSSMLHLAEAHRAAFPNARQSQTLLVRVSTLDNVLKTIELEPPVLLKLDVQGYEAHVLRGAAETLKRVDHVLLETSFKPMYEGEIPFTEIVRLMEGLGFRFLRPAGWLSNPKTEEILQIDALFGRQKLD